MGHSNGTDDRFGFIFLYSLAWSAGTTADMTIDVHRVCTLKSDELYDPCHDVVASNPGACVVLAGGRKG